jgi:hypothetical protein
MMSKHASVIASRCSELAHGLSYNESTTEYTMKRMLREASFLIDSQVVRVHKKKDGLLMVNARGCARFMTWRERAAYWLLGGRTEMRPNNQPQPTTPEAGDE